MADSIAFAVLVFRSEACVCDGVFLKRNWGGEVVNVSVLVAIELSGDGFREVLGVMEGAKKDKGNLRAFLKHLKELRLNDPKSCN